MAGAGISGLAVFYATAGGILLWSGIKGQTIKETISAVTSSNVSALSQAGSETVGTPSIGIEPGASASSGGSGSTSSGGGGGGSTPASASSLATNNGALGTSAAANKTLAEAIAATYGWTGAHFTALDEVIMRESGYSTTAQNASGALGIAQALGHGGSNTGGSLGNEYGGYGLTAAQAQSANSGSASWQLVWMMNYIKATYGSPEGAEQSEQTRGYY
jgi:hypothetical protein